MKERWLTLGLAAAALALFYALFFPKLAPSASQMPLPVSTETGADGLAGAARWLTAAGVPVRSLRQRYDQLDHLSAVPARGNLLISTLPPRLPMRDAERAALDRWLTRGNSLLLLAALDDTPRWAVGADPQWLADLQGLSGVRFRAGESDARQTLATLLRPQTLRIHPRARHPLTAGVASVQLASALPATRWHGEAPAGSATLAIAERADDGTPVLWVQARGAGQIILMAVAGAFSNGQIQQSDNARLLSNLIGWSRAPGGAVIFDDAHQGLVSFYDPHAFYADPRLHRSLGWIVLLWLVWVLGAQAQRSLQTPWQPVDETALLEASGRFFGGSVPPAQAARRLLTNFFNEIHRRLRQPEDDSAPWEWLGAQPGVGHVQLSELRQWQARSSAGSRVNLARLQNLLSQLRGAIG